MDQSRILHRLADRIKANEDFELFPDECRNARSTQPVLRSGNASSPKLVGHAAVFYQPGDPGTEFVLGRDVVERIGMHAFDRTIREKPDVRSCFNHDADHILGRTSSGTLRLSVDGVGLAYEVDLNTDSRIGQDVLSFLRRGDLSGSSFAFSVVSETWTEEGALLIRQIDDLILSECGCVTWPAYQSATASATGQGAGRSRGDHDADGSIDRRRRRLELALKS